MADSGGRKGVGVEGEVVVGDKVNFPEIRDGVNRVLRPLGMVEGKLEGGGALGEGAQGKRKILFPTRRQKSRKKPPPMSH